MGNCGGTTATSVVCLPHSPEANSAITCTDAPLSVCHFLFVGYHTGIRGIRLQSCHGKADCVVHIQVFLCALRAPQIAVQCQDVHGWDITGTLRLLLNGVGSERRCVRACTAVIIGLGCQCCSVY
jgi:hypothetical protein